MKETILLNNAWEIIKQKPVRNLSLEEIIQLGNIKTLQENEWLETSIPAQVHEILIKHNKIKDPSLTQDYEECLWVSDCDWIYRKSFKNYKNNRKQYLHFKGLDTLVDIYLNGEHIAYHDDMFLPLRVDVTGKLKGENVLLLHFHSVTEFMKNIDVPFEWKGKIEPKKFLRKSPEDLGDFLGAKPYLSPVGIFDYVEIEYIDITEIYNLDIDYELSCNYDIASLTLCVEGTSSTTDDILLKVEVVDPNIGVIRKVNQKVNVFESENWKVNLPLELDKIELWWPKGYGSQSLYEIIVNVYCKDNLKDSKRKKIGFRDIKMIEPFDYLINNKKVKLWGVNFVSINGITHCWNREKALQLLDLAENCNSNSIRVWGGAEPHSEEFYNECDRRGLLVWFEFYHIWGMYPESEEFREMCRTEAKHIVKQLKYHTSILFWCGGNETFMGTECDNPEDTYIGASIFEKDYKQVCNTLDPKRYYHINSPFGGKFANDPLVGDTHGYTHMCYVPGSDYPVLLSENTRVSIPVLRSMKKFIGEENIWPENYSNIICNPGEMPIPKSWYKISTPAIIPRIKNIEKFYDAKTPEALIYKFGAARSMHLRETVERCRRGRPSDEPLGERRCKGHFMWKFNDTWPQIYSSMLDYYLEPYMPYYALKNAHAPLLISFDIQNFIYAWIVNDTPKYVQGTLVVNLFNMNLNKNLGEIRSEVVIPTGESRMITSLNQFNQFSRDNILHAQLINENGEVIARTNEILDIERNMTFPNAKLELKNYGDVIEVTTDKFARSIEITGNEDGDEFGWVFEDNYFDLIPGEIKRVKIRGKHKTGTIIAKAYYSDHIALVKYGI